MINNIIEREGDLFNENIYYNNQRGVVRGNLGEGGSVLDLGEKGSVLGTMSLRPTIESGRRKRTWLFNSSDGRISLVVAEEGLSEG